ncbi:solute carrier family 45, member 1/2/4 [Sporothrix schenckii 1099-18]|uniref:Solute carrier family 45, member 1/2/4 n=1 Tax=Sporothrix schenckii 1099-18 TaxID=1397361 RepID=A0A0F2MI21_SPOSC|nr:solute carrier family 45, member 1/2/4 [Sporothrix schenckii 1099-18]KJR87826.1 solute carrier family 45, member 1/2/4 [Sporothrix schenckii 1099-18]
MPSPLDRSPDPMNAAGNADAGNAGTATDDAGNEHSPLLSPDAVDSDGAARADAGNSGDVDVEDNRGPQSGADPHDEDEWQRTKSVWYMTLLTISLAGLQIAWSVELSNGSPYLLSLGLSKSLMALVWIAGPLSGTLVQPYVGMLSDNCRVPWGKRKPFMLGGAAATIVSLLCLAWVKEMVSMPLHAVFGVDPASDGVRVAIIVAAVLWVYILDFAINTVQAAIRAFIVDCAPAHQQESANAMASRMTGIGNIIGYVAGYLNLPSFLWWLGGTQFKDLCAIACVSLGATVVLTCVVVRERDPRLEGPPPPNKPGVVPFFKLIFVSIRRLPPQIYKVCTVQFCAWVGFFPMLFYTSSYIGEIYVEPFLEANPHMTPEELDRLYEQATRVGTFALLIYSITSLCTNVFLPFFIAPTYDSRHVDHPKQGQQQGRPQQLSVVDSGAAGGASGRDHHSGEKKTKSWLDYLVIPGLTLRRAWMLSLLLFSGSMFCTVLVRSVAAATFLIGLVGITWALTLWAPWAIISAEISNRDAQIRARKQAARLARGENGDVAGDAGNHDDDDDDDDEEVDQAGVILGIHNMAIAAPQIIATVGSSIIFKFLQKPRGTPGDHSIAVVMALGGVTVLLAAYYVHKIQDEPDVDAGVVGDLGADGPYYTAVHDNTIGSDTGSEDGATLQRRMSSEQLSRASQDRATVARNSSFGGGLEY